MIRRMGIGIILVALLLLIGTTSAYPRAVLFTFDDSRASVYTIGYPIFAEHGYKATFYAVTDEIDPVGTGGITSMNLTQLTVLYTAGWDIADHTRHHEYFVKGNLSLSEQIAEIQGGKEDLDAWGFTRASSHLSYPGGQYNDNTTLAMNSIGMLTGRTVESFPQTVPPFNNDVFHLTGVRPLDPEYENEQYTYLESLSSDNVVIYLTHGIDDPDAGASWTTSAMLENMLAYMDTHNIPVWTITQMYENISASGPYSPPLHTATVYPSVDGYVFRDVDNSTFAEIISGPGTGVNYRADSFFGPEISTGANTQSGRFKVSMVGVLSFDTSTIPDDVTIESASLILHQKYLSYDGLGPFTMVVTNGNIVSDTSLSVNDYQTRGDLELTIRKPFTHITTGNNTFNFNSNGLLWINKKGSTILFLRRGDDIDGTYTGGPTWATSSYSQHRWSSFESIDTGDRPYLQIDYTISPAPVVSFTGTPVTGPAPLTVAFTDSSTGVSITNRRWDFGDGNVTNYAAATNPSHSYSSAGIYSVNLTVTNASGSNFQLRPNYITVTDMATFFVTTSGSSDGEIERANSGSGESFSSLRNGAGTGTNSSSPYLTLGIRSSNNNIANTYDLFKRNVFLFNTSELPDNAIINNVTFSVWSSSASLFKNQLGSATYGITGIDPITPGIVSQNDFQRFTATRYSDTDIPQTNIANYNYNNWIFNSAGIAAISKTGWTNVAVRTKWDIDNDTAGLTWLPYQNATLITLYGTENHVGKEPTLTIRYSLPQTPISPVANFTAIPKTGTAPLAVQFTDTSTNLPTVWNWSFGDGQWFNTTAGESRNATHIYASTGNYTVNLTVTNIGGSDTESKIDYIIVSNWVLPLPGFINPPTDPDNDGLIEDLNANGFADWDDAVVLFWNTDWIQENEPVASFDFNHNTFVDWDDAVVLFWEV